MPSDHDEKTREIAQDNRRTIREVKRTAEANSNLITAHIGSIANHEDRLRAIERWIQDQGSKPPATYPPADYPADIRSRADLQKLALAMFGQAKVDELIVDRRPYFLDMGKEMAQRYPDRIFRLNTDPRHPLYPNCPDDKHADAVGFRYNNGNEKVLDFGRDAEGADGAVSINDSIAFSLKDEWPSGWGEN